MEVALDELDDCMSALLGTFHDVDGDDDKTLRRIYDTAAEIRVHILERQTPTPSPAQEIETLKKQLAETEALLNQYEVFIAEWKQQLNSIPNIHSANVHDFIKR